MSNIDINEFKTLLLNKKSELEDNITKLSDEMNVIAADDGGCDIEDVASLITDNVQHKSLLEQQKYELSEVIHALGKINSNTYGVCEKTGKEIDIERLRAVPYARSTKDED
ncbi:MAG: TraR/DksA C4-type zinc finger protein [Campylobacterota bacterium]|nr:TraR/DksA C4-type zinc finger protein [Campylobacterota bacterium]